MSTVEVLGAALFLAFAVNRVVEVVVKPVKEKNPEIDLWWLFYVSLAIGGVASWYSGLNAFGELTALPAEVGRVVTALAVGGGPGVLADFLNYNKK